MFRPELDPDEMVRVLMEDAVETIARLIKSGFPVDAIPPHHTSVYFSTRADTEGVYRENLQLLTGEDPNMWAPLMLSRLDEGSHEEKYPLGSFLGFLGYRENDPSTQLLFGMLLSPTGDDAIGMYTEIQSLEDIRPLWVHPFEIAPHLNQLYVPGDASVIH